MNYYHQLSVEEERRYKYDTYNDFDELLYKARKSLDPDLIQKHFNYNTLEKMLETLFDTRGSYKNGLK